MFVFLATLHSLWDFSSPTRNLTQAFGSESANSNHWTAREFPVLLLLPEKKNVIKLRGLGEGFALSGTG